MDGLCLCCCPLELYYLGLLPFPLSWPQSPQTCSGPSWPDRSPDTVRGESLRPCPESERFPRAFGPTARGGPSMHVAPSQSAGFFL